MRVEHSLSLRFGLAFAPCCRERPPFSSHATMTAGRVDDSTMPVTLFWGTESERNMLGTQLLGHVGKFAKLNMPRAAPFALQVQLLASACQ